MSYRTFQNLRNSPLESFPSGPGILWWSVAYLKGDSVFNEHPGYIEVFIAHHKFLKILNKTTEGFSVKGKGDSVRNMFSFIWPVGSA